MVADQLGPRGVDQISTDSFGDEVTESRTRGQLIVHGPVTYVTDAFRTIDSARTDAERALLPIFVKHRRFAGQREYRFVIWAEEEAGGMRGGPQDIVRDVRLACRAAAGAGGIAPRISGGGLQPRAG